MEKKFGVIVLGEETSKKLYTYLDAENEAEKLVKKLNKTAYIFEIHSKVELSVEVTKIEEYRTLDICEINPLFDNWGDDEINEIFDNSDDNYLLEKK
jgi:hypothetical protein